MKRFPLDKVNILKKKNICLGLKHIKYVKSVDPFTSPKKFKKKNPWISIKVIGNKLNILKNVKKKIIHYLSCPSHRNYTPEKRQIIDE